MNLEYIIELCDLHIVTSYSVSCNERGVQEIVEVAIQTEQLFVQHSLQLLYSTPYSFCTGFVQHSL